MAKVKKQRLFEMFGKVAQINLKEEFNPAHYAWGETIAKMLAYAKANGVTLNLPQSLNGSDYNDIDFFLDKLAGADKISDQPTDQEIPELVNQYNSYSDNEAEKAFDRFSDDYFGGGSPVTDKEKYAAAAQQKREIGETLNESLITRFQNVNKVKL